MWSFLNSLEEILTITITTTVQISFLSFNPHQCLYATQPVLLKCLDMLEAFSHLSVKFRLSDTSLINSVYKMVLDCCLAEEEDKPQEAGAETSQSKVIAVKLYHWIKLVNTFLALCAVTDSINWGSCWRSIQNQANDGEKRIPSDNRIGAKDLGEEGKQTIQIVFSAKSSYSIMHLPRASTGFLGSQQFDCHTF